MAGNQHQNHLVVSVGNAMQNIRISQQNFYLDTPNLPQGRVTCVALSERADMVRDALRKRGITVQKVPASPDLESSIASHADMLFYPSSAYRWFCGSIEFEHSLKSFLNSINFQCISVHSPYPTDCALNAARVGKFLFCNPRTVSAALLEDAKRNACVIVPVRQGYTKCNTVPVTETAILTEDCGIAKAAARAGFDVLCIEPGFVRLEGYPYGFLGGACGKLSKSELAFAGDLSKHPQAGRICAFLEQHGVRAVSLCDGPLTDVGGILPLQEKRCVRAGIGV